MDNGSPIIFALDIGTRKVMGIAARQTGEGLEILASRTIEHTARPMLDGQIQNIEAVAKIVLQIKNSLEEHLGLKLTTAGVAVAGRDLITHRSKARRDFELEEEITLEIIKELELEAVDDILSDPRKNSANFYCAGYSPVYYELNGAKIQHPLGHRGKEVSCEIIVTLLNRSVLDSMFSVLAKAGLTPVNLTLEPIAAINAIVPPELRHLNIALVDIGAGTSDLALTQEGFIYAYGMVPMAGDEISEGISQALLTDFLTAENIKRSIDLKDKIEYEDIWGRKQEITSQQAKDKTSASVKKLAQVIAENALALCAQKPEAVIVVGGGSLTFNLIPELAESFGLPIDRVGSRLPQAIKSLKNLPPQLNSPEAVTPLGIALMTAQSQGLNFIEIEVNRKKFRLLDFKQKKDILGALTLSGVINNKRLYPKPGAALSCYVDGELRFIKGSLGQPARITLNGKETASLSGIINSGDKIEFQEAINGENGSSTLKDLLNLKPAEITFNRQAGSYLPAITVNGQKAPSGQAVMERSDIRILNLKAKDILESHAIDTQTLSERQVLVNINGHPKVLTQSNFSLRLNSQPCALESEVKNGDAIDFSLTQPTHYKIKDVIKIPERIHSLRIRVGEKDIEVPVAPLQIFMNGREVSPEEFLIDAAEIKTFHLKEETVMLSEIFRYIDFNPQAALGKKMRILVDDEPAGFTTPLSEGVRVKILFENREE